MKKVIAALAMMWILVIGMWIVSPDEVEDVDAGQYVRETTEHRNLEEYEWQPILEAEEIQEDVLKAYDDIPLSEEEQIHMQEVCRENNISYEFALALMESESHFDPEAVGDRGESIGYFQINSVNWPRMESEYGLDVSDPTDNITAGIKIMQELFEKYGDPFQVIMCYKCGESRGTELYDQGIYTTKQFDCAEICLNATNYERSHGK